MIPASYNREHFPLKRMDGESEFDHKLRLCKAKLNQELDLSWSDICSLLNLGISGESLRKRAYGYVEMEEHLKSGSAVQNRILAISDAHVPFNLPVSILQPYAGMVDTLIFNGDIMDCQSISSFPRLYRIDFAEEMVLSRKYFLDVIHLIRPKKVYVTVGNHEKRLGRYLSDRLNTDILKIMPDNPLDLIFLDGFNNRDRCNHTETRYEPLNDFFKNGNVEIIYTSSWHCKVGHTIFAHPLSYSSGMLKTTEKAVDYFLRKDRDFNAVVLGHTHRLGSYIQGNIEMFEQGCLCDLSRLDYAEGKLTLPQQNGCLYLCHDRDGNIINEKTKIIKL